MGLFSAAFQLGSMSEVSEEDANIFMEEFEKLVEDIDAIGIFVHNTTISLPMFLPGFGVAWGLFSAWSTGFAFAAIVSITPELEQIPPLTILYLSPFGLMELSAYSLATSRSFILIRAISKKTNLKPLFKPTIIEVGILLGLLLAGGFLEDYMIKLAQDEGFEMPSL
ncbi:MAG: stage II sporulation protein M [Nitrososphaeria archaeon]|nr:stage II sporulation protein M [Nitrosopumilaceae archaeon]NIP09142.1 stage II sporulation protein M [Nitrosopumilaceae archaeon]NIP91670.1 stage II sporulation protein M [Nitrososphaeria archaeon]NIS95510.1 stage II sporulation protein M [Nitrosopumilaceae archaeon]